MGFSTAVFLLAVVHAGVGVALARSATTLPQAVLRALAGSAVSTIVLTVVWFRTAAWFDLFALAHVAYLAITVTVPLIALTGLLAHKRSSAPLRTRAAIVVLSVGMLPAIAGLYATHIEPERLEVDHHEVTVARPGVEGEQAIRVAVLADLQTPRIREHELDAIARLVDSDPDLLLVAGDLWSTGVTEAEWPAFRELIESMVDGAAAVVIVEGDSDNVARLRRLADGTGAHVLADETLDVVIRGQAVRVAGLTLRERTANDAQRAAIDQLQSADPDTITVLLSHRPDVVYDLTETVDLVVAGHTHGGQVALPFVGPLLTLSGVPRSVAAGGLHEIDGQVIYVSTGVGMERSHAPQVRFGVRPSVGILDLLAVSDS